MAPLNCGQSFSGGCREGKNGIGFESLHRCAPRTPERILMRWFAILVEENLTWNQRPLFAGITESGHQYPMNWDLFAPALFF
jgi:hypothetical protein